jgi:hypothetical protein
MSNPFLEDGESLHEYGGTTFVVDYYPARGGAWQCSDAKFTVKGRATTKQEAIEDAHREWDEYTKSK